jgi:endonuclease/exonuclease/phosphatase family metal-dependent hydrolase
MVRLVTYNVHGCKGMDWCVQADRPLEVLRSLDADCIALQEFVDAPHGGGQRLLDQWARELGMNAVYAPSFERGREIFGNALLTRFDILEHRDHDFSTGGYRRRLFPEVTMRAGEATLRVLVVHFGVSPRERARQTAQLAELCAVRAADVRVCAGDLNEPWRNGAASRVLSNAFRRSPPLRTFPAPAPLFALDSVWVHPSECLVGVRVDRSPQAVRASDHLPLVATLRLPSR